MNREQISLLNGKTTDLDWYYSRYYGKLNSLFAELLFMTFVKKPADALTIRPWQPHTGTSTGVSGAWDQISLLPLDFFVFSWFWRIYMSPILLLSWIFYVVTLQSGQLKHSDSYLRGRQRMFMGLLFVLLATIWVKVELLSVVSPSGECRVQGNTPDFMLEHFIVHPTDDTRWTPPIGRWSLTVIAIQLCTQG